MDPATTTLATTTVGLDPVVSTVFGYLNIFAGVMFAISLTFMITGYVYFFVRLGLDGVSKAFDIMHWGVVTLFVLVVMLGIVRYIQYDTHLVLVILATVATLALVIGLVQAFSAPAEKKEEKK